MEKQDATAVGPFVTYQIVRYLWYNVLIDAPSYKPWEFDAPKIPLIAEAAGLTMGKGKGRMPSQTGVSSGAFPNGESDKGQKRCTDELKMQLNERYNVNGISTMEFMKRRIKQKAESRSAYK